MSANPNVIAFDKADEQQLRIDLSAASKCCWPANSDTSRGRIRSASGACDELAGISLPLLLHLRLAEE